MSLRKRKRGKNNSGATTPIDENSINFSPPNQSSNFNPLRELHAAQQAQSAANAALIDTMNLHNFPKPFKNPHFKRASARRNKPLKAIITQEKQRFDNFSIENSTIRSIPTYWSIEVPPPLIPPKHYCDLTGLPAPYTDPKTNLRFHSKDIYTIIHSLPHGAENSYLAMRNAAVVLK